MARKLSTFILFLMVVIGMTAQKTTSKGKSLYISTLGVSGSTEEINVGNRKYVIQQSFGQAAVIGTYEAEGHVLRQGFIQPNVWSKIVDKELDLTLEGTAYPNPFQKEINLLFSEEVEDEFTVFLYDMLGKKLFDKQYPPLQTVTVDLPQLSIGQYILKVTTKEKQLIRVLRKY